jgi:hypothetical protein
MKFTSSPYGKDHYFVSFRDFRNIDEPIMGYYFGNNRALQIYVRGDLYFNFYTLDWESVGINKGEQENLIKNLIYNRIEYLSKFRTLKGKIQTKKIEAEALTAQKAMNLQTISQLKEEVTTKQLEFTLLKDVTLSDLTKSEAVKLQIRNFGSERDSIKNNKLNQLLGTLNVQLQQIDSIQQDIKQNKDKIEGIVAIDQNDLSAKTIELISKLKALNELYLEADPRHLAIKDIIENFATKQIDLPNVLA